MTGRQLKVVLISKGSSSIPMPGDTDALTKMNAELVEATCTTENAVIEVIKDADIILTRNVEIKRRAMEVAPKCKAIICSSVGFDMVDIDAATDNNIIVVNNPSSEWCVEEVSNHAITLLLACAKKLAFLNSYTKQGYWAEAKRGQAPMGAIYRQALGLVGCGSIGRMTAKKAQCFGLKILGFDPYIDESLVKEHGITPMSLPELLKGSDFVSIHSPLSDETYHLIGEKEFAQMKPTAYFINTARGQIVDEVALINALRGKRIAGAGLDVFEKEPVDLDNPLLKMDNVVVTPHCASYSDASFKRPMVFMLQQAAKVLSGQWPRAVVNKTVKPKVNLVEES